MNIVSRKVMQGWVSLGPRFLPFADAATPELPLARLLRLSLFQVSVGMALVLLVGTLNRVMIVELGVPAALVAIMLSLPLVFAPFRALIGFRSDTHRSLLGWRRVPFMWQGTLIQFGGLAIMPFALLVLAGEGESGATPIWIGQAAAALSFLMVGAGVHTTQTIGLALANDLAPEHSQPKVVGLMYVMLLLGMIVSALAYGALLHEFTNARLIQVIQGSAVVTMFLNIVALWKMEPRDARRTAIHRETPSFAESWARFISVRRARLRLFAIGIGTMGFSMQDVLLEPYGGQVLRMSVSATTLLTACLAAGGLLGFGLASKVLSRGADPFRMASHGAMVGVPGFLAIMASGPEMAPGLFALGVFIVGFGGGLFSHGTLTATMVMAPEEQTGLALGAWGAVQATAAGVAMALGGVIRDLAAGIPGAHAGTGYQIAYGLEVAMLLATVLAMLPLLRDTRRETALA
jgi:BCD family chlorophyll transporter-like MFS transporter